MGNDLLSREMLSLMMSHLQVGDEAPTYIIRLKKPLEFYSPPRVLSIPDGGIISIETSSSSKFGCSTATVIVEDTFGLKSPDYSSQENTVSTVKRARPVVIGNDIDLAAAQAIFGTFAQYVNVTGFTSSQIDSLNITASCIVVGGPSIISDAQLNGATRLGGTDRSATDILIQQYFTDNRSLFGSPNDDVKIKNRFYYDLLMPETWIQICLGYSDLSTPVLTGAIDKVEINSEETRITLSIRCNMRYLVDQYIDAAKFGLFLYYPRTDKMMIMNNGSVLPNSDVITYVVISNVNGYLSLKTGPDNIFGGYGKVYNGQTFQYLGQSVNSDWTIWYKIMFNGSPSWIPAEYGTITHSNEIVSTKMTVRVDKLNTSSSLNVRSGPSTDNSIIGQVSSGDILSYLGQQTSNYGGLWYHINYNNGSGNSDGWVYSGYCSVSESSNPDGDSANDIQVQDFHGSTDVYSTTDITSLIIGEIYDGNAYTYVSSIQDSSGNWWHQITFDYDGSKTGWITDTVSSLQQDSVVLSYHTMALVSGCPTHLHIRSGPGTNYGVLKDVQNGMTLSYLGSVTGSNGDGVWHHVLFQNTVGTQEGYASSQYITLQSGIHPMFENGPNPPVIDSNLMVNTTESSLQRVIGNNIDILNAQTVFGSFAQYIDMTGFTESQITELNIRAGDIVVGGGGSLGLPNFVDDTNLNGATRLSGSDSAGTLSVMQTFFTTNSDLFMDPKKSSWTAAAIVHDLASMALHIFGGNGIPYALDRTICSVMTAEYNLIQSGQLSKFVINTMKCPTNVSYFDTAMKVVNQLGNVLFRSDRYGNIVLSPSRIPSQLDKPDWEVYDYIDMTAVTLTYNSKDIRNRIVVESDTGTSMFEHCGITSTMCQGVNRTMAIEVKSAANMEQRKEAARSAFQQMFANWKLKAIAIIGNPMIEIYDVIKVHDSITLDVDLYRVLDYKHNSADSGFITTLDLEWCANIPSEDVRLISEEFPIAVKTFNWPLTFVGSIKTITIKMANTIRRAKLNITNTDGGILASINILGIGLVVPPNDAPIISPSSQLASTSFTATAYTPTGNNTADGSTPVQGTTIAVDPTVIPDGSAVRVLVTDSSLSQYNGDYIAQDTGGLIIGQKIDIFMNLESDATTFGVQPVTLTVLGPTNSTQSVRVDKNFVSIMTDSNQDQSNFKRYCGTGFIMAYTATVGSFYEGIDPLDNQTVYVWSNGCSIVNTTGNPDSSNLSVGGVGAVQSFIDKALSLVGICGYAWGAYGDVLTPDYLTYLEGFYGVEHYFWGSSVDGSEVRVDKWMGEQVFDCRGLVIWCLQKINVISSSEMYDAQGIFTNLCTEISQSDIRPGDLFFRQSGNEIYHVGIIVNTTISPISVVEAKGTQYGVVQDGLPNAERYGRITRLQNSESIDIPADSNSSNNTTQNKTTGIPTSYTVTSNYDVTQVPANVPSIVQNLNGNILFYSNDCVLYNVVVKSDVGIQNELVLYWSPITVDSTMLDLGYEVLIY